MLIIILKQLILLSASDAYIYKHSDFNYENNFLSLLKLILDFLTIPYVLRKLKL